MATAAVLGWAHAGLAAAAALPLVLVVSVPLLRTVGEALRSSDDLVELRHVPDARAAEVARLAADRERLLSRRSVPRSASAPASRRRCTTARSSGSSRSGKTLQSRASHRRCWPDISTRRSPRRERDHLLVPSRHGAGDRVRSVAACRGRAVSRGSRRRPHRDGTVEDQMLAGTTLLRHRAGAHVNAVKHAVHDRDRRVGRQRRQAHVLEVRDDGVGIESSGRQAGRASGTCRARDGAEAGRGAAGRSRSRREPTAERGHA